MEIREAIIQGLIKESGSGEVREAFRDTPSAVNDQMVSLGDELLRIYTKLTNNYGCFDQNTGTYPFPSQLNSYYSNQVDLTDFSKSTCRAIASRMGSAPSATGGYTLYLRYSSQGRDWLLIVMLKLKTGTGIDPNSLELNESLAFDVNNLHEAARIDLEKWQANVQPYLSFIKRGGRQDDVTRYFRLALGCTEYTDSRSNTEQALKAVDAYCDDKQWTAEQKSQARRITYNYCDEKSRDGEPVNLKALSAMLNDQEPESFTDFVREQGYAVNETFEPHKKVYSRFKRISASFGTVKVSFDVDDVESNRIDYDNNASCLIIRNPSPELVSEINRAKGNEPSN